LNWKEKIRRWCARSERSRGEVLKRLSELDVPSSKAIEYLSILESTDFVNQTRFMNAFTHDHFVLKNWGPLKIKEGLCLKGCSSGEISSTLSSFTPEIIKEKLAEVITIRQKTEQFELQTNKPRLIRYLQSKGFPLELIIEVLDSSS